MLGGAWRSLLAQHQHRRPQRWRVSSSRRRSSSASASASAGGTSATRQQQRPPGLWDRVVLSPGTPDTRGLLQGVVATVVKLHPKGKPEFYYRVEIPNTRAQPWIGADQLTLLDPDAPRPKPREPVSNECCGSDCPK